jgi:NAD(P)H-dependent FMN reductase
MAIPRIIVIPGSSRSGSWNVKLAGTITKALAERGAEATQVSLGDYEMPLYNGDLENSKGIPAKARQLGALISAHHGVVLVNPEYNGSISPLMKNAIDWMSRDLGDIKPYQGRVFALASCSPGALGGIRALAHVRDVMVSVGADLVTPQLAVGGASTAFDESEQLAQERHQALLQKMCTALIERASYLARG